MVMDRKRKLKRKRMTQSIVRAEHRRVKRKTKRKKVLSRNHRNIQGVPYDLVGSVRNDETGKWRAVYSPIGTGYGGGDYVILDGEPIRLIRNTMGYYVATSGKSSVRFNVMTNTAPKLAKSQYDRAM